MATKIPLSISEPDSQQTHSVTSEINPTDFSAVGRVLILVKENQLATAAILFFAWQAGVFLEAWIAVQSMCGA